MATTRRRTPAKTRPKSRARARRAPAPGLPRPHLPELTPHQLDLLGLGLAALGVFLAFVMYLGSAGGEVGDAGKTGLRLLLGQVAYAVPAVLVLAGILVIARTLLPAVRPLRAGAWCLFGAVTLAFAAGTLGLGGGVPRAAWAQDVLEGRGGAVGETLYWISSKLFSDVGAHILAVFLFLAGLLLVSGVTIAGVLRSTADHGARMARTGAATLAPAARAPRTAAPRVPRTPPPAAALDDDEDGAVPEPLTPPELDDARLVVRATHVEAPSLDGAERYPDLFGEDGVPLPLGDPPTARRATAARTTGDDESDPRADALDATPDAVTDEIPELELEEAEEPGVTTGGPVTVDPADLTPQGRYRAHVTDDPEFEWHMPDPRFLTRSTADQNKPDTVGQERTAGQLVEALGHFGIDSKVVGMVSGPHITRYELRLAPGIKVGRVANLKDDLAYALAATDVRILAPIPGKQAVGVEVPNARRRIVHLGDVFQEPPADWSPLTVWLGKDVAGRAIGVDLAKMPHLLVAGTTGAGKSGCVNAMLSSILLHADPHEVKLVLVDPKQVELNHYESIPHLLTPVITSPRLAANALQNLVREMEMRYGIMSLARTRSLPELNRRRAERGEPALPYILCVIDELADLMMVAPADVEDSIIRLAQKARAVGIHLVLATQSPRVDVITGMIKANVPSRIAFAV
ncbi:MAG: translocase FtsK, partial [Conexibacter sp.]|nr:translocase FtsK [Conexibacter sp.]